MYKKKITPKKWLNEMINKEIDRMKISRGISFVNIFFLNQ